MSSALARELKAAYLRVDVIEQAMRDSGMRIEGPEGYAVCYALASQQLRLGLDVIADTVNPIRITREAWRNVAECLEAPFLEIEVVCSDPLVHKHRIETRTTDIPGLTLPTWEQVLNRQYDVWDRDHLVIDTAHQTTEESLMTLYNQLALQRS